MSSILPIVKDKARIDAIKKEIKKKCAILIAGYKKFGNIENLEEIQMILNKVNHLGRDFLSLRVVDIAKIHELIVLERIQNNSK